MKTRPDPNPCKHAKQYGEGTTWPLDASLEHFDTCLTPERRLEVFGGIRDMAERGSRCTLHDHDGAVRRMNAYLEEIVTLRQVARTDQAYIHAMVSQLRQLVAEGSRDGAYIRECIAIILETRTESVEQVDPS
jgi:hypothetical protein